jgi:hypothetical protein
MTPAIVHGFPDRRKADLPAGTLSGSAYAGLGLDAGGWLLALAPLPLQVMMGEIERQSLVLSSLCGLPEMHHFSMMNVKSFRD